MFRKAAMPAVILDDRPVQFDSLCQRDVPHQARHRCGAAFLRNTRLLMSLDFGKQPIDSLTPSPSVTLFPKWARAVACLF
jgi:hypothetical protein